MRPRGFSFKFQAHAWQPSFSVKSQFNFFTLFFDHPFHTWKTSIAVVIEFLWSNFSERSNLFFFLENRDRNVFPTAVNAPVQPTSHQRYRHRSMAPEKTAFWPSLRNSSQGFLHPPEIAEEMLNCKNSKCYLAGACPVWKKALHWIFYCNNTLLWGRDAFHSRKPFILILRTFILVGFLFNNIFVASYDAHAISSRTFRFGGRLTGLCIQPATPGCFSV